jgi:hypothetical protein
MIELIHKIDALIEEVAAASFWGYVKSVIAKIREILVLEKEDKAVEDFDILFG